MIIGPHTYCHKKACWHGDVGCRASRAFARLSFWEQRASLREIAGPRLPSLWQWPLILGTTLVQQIFRIMHFRNLGRSLLFGLTSFVASAPHNTVIAATFERNTAKSSKEVKELTPQQELANWFFTKQRVDEYNNTAEFSKRLKALRPPSYTKSTAGEIYTIRFNMVETEYPTLKELNSATNHYILSGRAPLDRRIQSAMAAVLNKANENKQCSSELTSLTRLITVDNAQDFFGTFAQKSGKRLFEFIYSKTPDQAARLSQEVARNLKKTQAELKVLTPLFEKMKKNEDSYKTALRIEEELLKINGKYNLGKLDGKLDSTLRQIDSYSCSYIANIIAMLSNPAAKQHLEKAMVRNPDGSVTIKLAAPELFKNLKREGIASDFVDDGRLVPDLENNKITVKWLDLPTRRAALGDADTMALLELERWIRGRGGGSPETVAGALLGKHMTQLYRSEKETAMMKNMLTKCNSDARYNAGTVITAVSSNVVYGADDKIITAGTGAHAYAVVGVKSGYVHYIDPQTAKLKNSEKVQRMKIDEFVSKFDMLEVLELPDAVLNPDKTTVTKSAASATFPRTVSSTVATPTVATKTHPLSETTWTFDSKNGKFGKTFFREDGTHSHYDGGRFNSDSLPWVVVDAKRVSSVHGAVRTIFTLSDDGKTLIQTWEGRSWPPRIWSYVESEEGDEKE